MCSVRERLDETEVECRRLAAESAGLLREVSSCAVRELGRAASNPRSGEQLVDVVEPLLAVARERRHADLRTVVRQWERLADADGAALPRTTGQRHADAFIAALTAAASAGVDGRSPEPLINVSVDQETFEHHLIERFSDDRPEPLDPSSFLERSPGADTAAGCIRQPSRPWRCSATSVGWSSTETG